MKPARLARLVRIRAAVEKRKLSALAVAQHERVSLETFVADMAYWQTDGGETSLRDMQALADELRPAVERAQVQAVLTETRCRQEWQDSHNATAQVETVAERVLKRQKQHELYKQEQRVQEWVLSVWGRK